MTQPTPDTGTEHMTYTPGRVALASLATVILFCLAATIQTAVRREWGWALLGAAVTVVFTRDLVDVALARRRGRR